MRTKNHSFCFLKNHNAGFTMLELMVSILAISIFLAVMLYSVNEDRQRAKVVRVKNDFSQILRTAQIIESANGYFPNDSMAGTLCPKDIPIVAGETTWGSYITLCTDPWGNPYEWNNLCQNGVPRSPENSSACPTFSNWNQGVIGVKSRGPDGKSSPDPLVCEGDDICFGRNGFSNHGWE